MPFLTKEESWALTLTTFAGLSTTVGAAFAVSALPPLLAAASAAALQPHRSLLPFPHSPYDPVHFPAASAAHFCS